MPSNLPTAAAMSTQLHLCHVFVLVEPGAPETAALDRAGLRESYRRSHPGQGTANRCYCFDNAYLELLWVEDADALRSPAIRRTGLAERAEWRTAGTCPFGLAVRTDEAGQPLPFPTWDFTPPYLPAGMAIPVSTASEDPHRPFVFRSPGASRPDQWTDGRAGERQTAAGLAEIAAISLHLPVKTVPADDLSALEAAGLIALGTSDPAMPHRMVLTLSRSDGGTPRRLSLPDFRWLD